MKAYLKIEMPACINCRFCQAGDSTSYCLAQSHELEHGGWYMHHIKWDEGIGYEAQKTWREKTCPLVPVPPHGRLIDADALIEDLERQCKEVFRIDAVSPNDYWITRNEAYNEALWKSWVESFGKYLKARPTIIPAEEGKA